MDDELKKTLDGLIELMKVVEAVKQMSGLAGNLYSALLVYNIDKVETTLIDSFTHGSKALEGLTENDKKNLYDKAALLGCLVRFKKDLEDNTYIAREVKQRYETLTLNK